MLFRLISIKKLLMVISISTNNKSKKAVRFIEPHGFSIKTEEAYFLGFISLYFNSKHHSSTLSYLYPPMLDRR